VSLVAHGTTSRPHPRWRRLPGEETTQVDSIKRAISSGEPATTSNLLLRAGAVPLITVMSRCAVNSEVGATLMQALATPTLVVLQAGAIRATQVALTQATTTTRMMIRAERVVVEVVAADSTTTAEE
jgi:hypothetical protein